MGFFSLFNNFLNKYKISSLTHPSLYTDKTEYNICIIEKELTSKFFELFKMHANTKLAFFLLVFNKVIQYKQKYWEIHEIGTEPVIWHHIGSAEFYCVMGFFFLGGGGDPNPPLTTV